MEFIKEPKHLPFGLGVTDENLDKAFMFIRDWFFQFSPAFARFDKDRKLSLT